MNPDFRSRLQNVIIGILILCGYGVPAETFRVAAYNVETYLDQPTETRSVKSVAARAKVRESILALKPDILSLEEMGSVSALTELRESLKASGLDLPYWEHVSSADTNIHVAILSKFPIIERRSHTNEDFLLGGRRHRVSRGFAEVDIQVATNYTLTVIAAHLKSRRPVPEADEKELRFQEAKLLREKIDARYAENPRVHLVVLGDFNDTKDSPSTKVVIGRGKNKLIDTRPAERNGDNALGEGTTAEQRTITWTHHYAKEDTCSRIDYILISPSLAREWIPNETYIGTIPNWGVGSDHRPILATFDTENK
jgi:endonuclease/exonuclease/phosphatase family metal-dependent hydrolase